MPPRSGSPATPREVLGVPFLPPAAATAAGNRVRGALGRLHAAMAPPPLRVIEGLFGLLEHRVLVAICDAGVPDALTGPTTTPALAGRLEVDAERLERLLRFAATRGWVRIDRRGRVRPTRVTRFLREDHPGGWRAWVEFAGGDEVVAAVGALSVRSADPFADTHGVPFFEWMAAHPERWATFDQAMAAGGRMHALGLAAALDWSESERICDVGGGTGALLATLLDALPGASGALLDLPGVVERAVEHPRLETIAGDAFAEVPRGFDTYLLVNVIHDWGDDDAARILGRVADAAASGARVVVVDNEATTVPTSGVAVATDVLMAALTPGGKERDVEGFAALGRRAGLRLERTIRLASDDVAHVFRPSAADGDLRRG